jgi:hypothetical protein
MRWMKVYGSCHVGIGWHVKGELNWWWGETEGSTTAVEIPEYCRELRVDAVLK